MLADIIFTPLVLLVCFGMVSTIGEELANQLMDSLTFRITDFLASVLERDVGMVAGEDIIAFLGLVFRRIANPLLATSLANYLISILPQAIVDASVITITEAVGPKTARQLQPQVTSYLQCMYCYEKGLYCKQCWWSADMTWLQREWFMGGDTAVGALDL